jgi:hypothetical protein
MQTPGLNLATAVARQTLRDVAQASTAAVAQASTAAAGATAAARQTLRDVAQTTEVVYRAQTMVSGDARQAMMPPPQVQPAAASVDWAGGTGGVDNGRNLTGTTSQRAVSEAVWIHSTSPHCCVYSGHSDSVICLEGTEGRLISGSVDGSIRVWSVQQPVCEAVLEGHTDWVRCMNARGNIIISGSDDKAIRFWDMETGACIKALHTHNSVNCLHMFADVVFCGGEEGFVFVIDSESGGELARLQGHSQSVNGMTVWDEGDALVTASADCTVRIWSLTNHECLRVLRHHAFSVNCLAIHASVLYTGSGDCTLQAVKLRGGAGAGGAGMEADAGASATPALVFTGHTSPIFCLNVPSSDVVVTGGGDCSGLLIY